MMDQKFGLRPKGSAAGSPFMTVLRGWDSAHVYIGNRFDVIFAVDVPASHPKFERGKPTTYTASAQNSMVDWDSYEKE